MKQGRLSIHFGHNTKDAMKRIAVLSFFLFTLICGISAQSSVHIFGENSEKALAFIGVQNTGSQTEHQLTQIIKHFEENPPNIRVIITIMEKPDCELPKEYAHIPSDNETHKIINMLSEYTDVAVVLVDQSGSNNIAITAGVQGKTTPSRLLKNTYNALNSKKEYRMLNFFDLLLYRLKWIEEDSTLAEYFTAHIPAIKLTTTSNITKNLLSIAKMFETNAETRNEKNYLAIPLFHLLIIPEKILLQIILIIVVTVLFFVFMFDFLFSKKTSLPLKNSTPFFWIPVFFFLVNISSLFIGEIITKLTFYLRFKNELAVGVYPDAAILLKHSIALLSILLFIKVIRFLPFPKDLYIHGYIARTLFLLHLIVFSAFEPSLLLFYIPVYIFSYGTQQAKKTSVQIFFLTLILLCFSPFLYFLHKYRDTVVSLLFRQSNSLLAFAFLPFNFLLLKFSVTTLRKKNSTKSLGLITLAGIIFFLQLTIFLLPYFNKGKSTIFIQENLINAKHSIHITSNINIKETQSLNNQLATVQNAKNSSTINGTVKTKKQLQRNMGRIEVSAKIQPLMIKITATTKNGLAIYEADKEFLQTNGGTQASFTFFCEKNITVNFSSKKDADLKVIAEIWSYENPFNLNLKDIQKKASDTTFLFYEKKELTIFQEEKL